MLYLSIFLSIFAVSLISLIGAITLFIKKDKLEHFLLYFVSFSVGALFGEVFLHIIPEIGEEIGFTEKTGLFFLAGILLFFVVEKFIHWHHCHHVEHDKHKIHPVAFTNLIGDGLHNFIDGAIIASAFLVSWPLGVATTLAVIVHEVPQEIGDFGVLLYFGLSKTKALFLNLLSALLAFGGGLAALLLAEKGENILPIILSVAGGGFVYIAGSDLIPELHRECRLCKTFWHFVFIAAGIGMMMALKLIG